MIVVPVTYTIQCYAGPVDRFGFNAHVWRASGSSSASDFSYTAAMK